MMYTVIVENDESQYGDETGVLYHFPKVYSKHLPVGRQLLYYKGKIKKKEYASLRLSNQPHYFATATVASIYPDKKDPKRLYALIDNYRPFNHAIPFKIDGEYLEEVPPKRVHNYWQFAVRSISKKVYDNILSHLNTNEVNSPPLHYEAPKKEIKFDDTDLTYQSKEEGKPQQVYVTKYERNPRYRKQAIIIHGDTCFACGFNFGEVYGEYAEGFIHIHHIEPVSEFDAPKVVNPETDLIPVCANCHSVIHRKRSETLSLEKLKAMIEENKKP